MTDFIDTIKIAIPCPNCSHEIVKTVAWINNHESFDCAECGTAVGLANVQHVTGPGEKPSDLVEEIQRQITRANKAR